MLTPPSSSAVAAAADDSNNDVWLCELSIAFDAHPIITVQATSPRRPTVDTTKNKPLALKKIRVFRKSNQHIGDIELVGSSSSSLDDDDDSCVVFYNGTDKDDVTAVVRLVGEKFKNIVAILVIRNPSCTPRDVSPSLPVFVLDSQSIALQMRPDPKNATIGIQVISLMEVAPPSSGSGSGAEKSDKNSEMQDSIDKPMNKSSGSRSSATAKQAATGMNGDKENKSSPTGTMEQEIAEMAAPSAASTAAHGQGRHVSDKDAVGAATTGRVHGNKSTTSVTDHNHPLASSPVAHNTRQRLEKEKTMVAARCSAKPTAPSYREVLASAKGGGGGGGGERTKRNLPNDGMGSLSARAGPSAEGSTDGAAWTTVGSKGKDVKVDRQDGGSGSDMDEDATPDAVDMQLEYGDKEQKQGGLLGKMMKQAVKFFGSESWSDVFGDLNGWHEKGNFKRYRDSMKVIKEAARGGGDKNGKTQEIAKEVYSYLKRGIKHTPFHLAFAANVVQVSDYSELATLVLEKLHSMHEQHPRVFAVVFQSHKHFSEQELKPHNAFLDFFKVVFESWPYLGPFSMNSDKLLVCVLGAWNEFGLFRRDDIDWQHIRNVATVAFFNREINTLETVIPKSRVLTLGLFLCGNADHALQMLIEVREKYKYTLIFVEPEVVAWFSELIRSSTNSKLVADVWRTMFELLKIIRFGTYVHEARRFLQCRQAVIYTLVHHASFSERGSFRFYVILLESVSKEHRDYEILVQSVRDCLLADLTSKGPSPSMEDFLFLLNSIAAELLKTEKTENAVYTAAESFMLKQLSLHSKLRFIDSLHAILSSNTRSNRPLSLALHLVALAVDCTQKQVMWEEVFLIAKTQPALFNSVGQDFTDSVARDMLAEAHGKCFIEQPALLARVFHVDPDHNAGLFYKSLCSRVEYIVCQAATPIKVASSFYRRASAEKSLISFAQHVFFRSYSVWNPDTLSAILGEDSETLQLLFQCLETGLSASRDALASVVVRWRDSFQADEVTKGFLQMALEHCSTASWAVLQSGVGTTLPAATDIQEKLNEIERLKETIVVNLSGPEGRSLCSILRGYNCQPTPRSILGQLLLRYEALLPSEESNCVGTTTKFKSSVNDILLSQLRDDCSEAERFRTENDQLISLCDYFLTNKSALFRKGMAAFIKTKLDMKGLTRALQRTLQDITVLFGSKTSFRLIDCACKTVAAGGISLEVELEILSGCPVLDLNAVDQDRFKAAAMMSNFAEPLQRFVCFCRQFKFGVVESDSSFNELAEISDALISGEVLGFDAQSSVEFSNKLVALLYAGSKEESHARMRSQVDGRLPGLRLLGDISLHCEIWNFIREKEWFGEDGLKRFYEEHNNVTNVLLGNSVSFEMSVLDNLEPTVRAISYIGSLSAEKDIGKLLDGLENSPDVARCSQGGSLLQVQSHLSQISDWFTDGVDDIAAVFGQFEAVHHGQYCLNTSQNGQPTLTLKYRSVKERKEKSLQGKDLDRFVQHVSLIEHEDDQVALRVSRFLEQHQVVSKASENVLEMIKMGFGADTGSFICSVGGDHIDDATALLLASEAAARENDGQLQHLRKLYPESSLFSTEELRLVFELAANGPESETWPDLARIISRLLDESRVESVSFEERMQVCATVVSNMQDDLNRGSGGWLRVACKLIENLRDSFGDNARQARITGRASAKITLHTMAIDDSHVNGAVLDLIRLIYKNRLPHIFEVLDAQLDGCTRDLLEVFLQRAQTFTANIFVILNVDSFSGVLLEQMLNFLSKRHVSVSGIHLHCIQRKASNLHTGPWIDGNTWDLDSLHLELDRAALNDTSWRALIRDRVSLEDVSILWTPKSGTGKTHFIRSQLRDIIRNVPDSEVAQITIHENSCLPTLIDDLTSKFSRLNTKRACHVNFCYMPDRSGATSSWLESINQFFFSLLILRSVHDPVSGRSFHLGERNWQIFVELPESASDQVWLRENVPVLACCGTRHTPPKDFVIDPDVRRVCTYLRAHSDNTIDRQFTPSRQILFVLDWSLSMHLPLPDGNTPLGIATDNALRLFDSHVLVGDLFGLTMFDDTTDVVIPLQEVSDEITKGRLRAQLHQVRQGGGGGTDMYQSLLQSIPLRDSNTWLVCLTDGYSTDSSNMSRNQLRHRLLNSSDTLRIILIGVNLQPAVEQEMRNLCGKYMRSESGCFIRSGGTLEALNESFDAVSRRIPVSETFELYDGVLSDEDSRFFLREYTRDFLGDDDLLMQKFWLRFLYRRVKVFDMNKEFNENVKYDKMGSTLMETMLEEAKRLLSQKQSRDWITENHAQLVYDFVEPNSPQFRLVCTAPDLLDPELKARYEALDLPGFRIPTKQELSKRATLHRLLSQALGVPLQTSQGGERLLNCVEENGFILTLDFAMKLLNIHERAQCRVPCLMEGETGVSKTALTKMYAILRNSSLKLKAEASASEDIQAIEREMGTAGHRGSGETALSRLLDLLESAAAKSIGDETEVAGTVFELLREKQLARSNVFRSTSNEFSLEHGLESNTSNVRAFLTWFAKAELEQVFFEVNVDASLTEQDVVDKFREVRAAAKKLSASRSTSGLVVVFLDEINTTSVMGLFKEIVVDHSIMGEPLEDNVVIISACNPCRTQATTKGSCLLENDLGREWASGHYQVVALPTSLTTIKWAFGSLTANQEKEFIFRRLERLGGGVLPMSSSLRRAMTEVVSASQEAIRHFAGLNIRKGLLRVNGDLSEASAPDFLKVEAVDRATSVVSLRDIQRTFNLYEFFLNEFKLFESGAQRDAMMLAVGVVYYMRLDNVSREQFTELINNLPTERGAERNLHTIVDEAMNAVIDATDIGVGIALTRGLKENVFMTLVCLLSRTPLLIVGPPGTSKTLAVSIVADNAHGEDSPSGFYRRFPRLSTYHYQCSKESTSKEIAAVFQKATQRQEKLDSKKHAAFVFMDEAGHPEDKESLKVLHYLLEGHMSTTAQVGFVAISNHILDAAKSNRCALLLRQDPDENEMMTITKGVLFDSQGSSTAVEFVEFDLEHLGADDFAQRLQVSHGEILTLFSKKVDMATCIATDEAHPHTVGTGGPPSSAIGKKASSTIGIGSNFFGLRDYIYFLKALRNLSTFEMLGMSTSSDSIVFAIERNFNGVNPDTLREIALIFLSRLTAMPRSVLISRLIQSLRDPLDVIRQSLSMEERHRDHFSRGRYKLLIDKTEDDSIIRLLASIGIVDLTPKSTFKLSQLVEDVNVEHQRLIAGVKYAALQGQMTVLSQTEPVNEAMYDLLNQRYRIVAGRMYANIACGGQSRRCLVRPTFEVLVHIRAAELKKIPAPFLNRFEKYSLGTDDVLRAGWTKLGRFAAVIRQARARVLQLLKVVCDKKGFFGWVDEQTVDSVFIDLLPAGVLTQAMPTIEAASTASATTFADCVAEFLGHVTSLRMTGEDIASEILMAKSCLPHDLSLVLLDMISIGHEQDLLRIKKGMYSMLTDGFRQEKASKVCAILIQIITTKVAVGRLMQIATPEGVFLSKDLPSEVVTQYFSQEHFSLRRLIAKTANAPEGGNLVVYTRSDASIDSLPSHSAVRGAPPLDPEQLAKIRATVYEDTDDLVVEHLSTLRSEQRLRLSVEAWIKDKRRIYVLMIDMGHCNAVDHVNFSRTFMEQRRNLCAEGAIFVLLLHYPPSVANRTSCYPALFLNGWEHVFLDGIGYAGPDLGVETCIEQACSSRHCETRNNKEELIGRLSVSLQSLLPRVIGHVSTRRIESPSGEGGQLSYDARYQWLIKVMRTAVGGETIGEIICRKFSTRWLEDSLCRTMMRASEGLLKGTTQLSLSMSVRTNMMDSFDAYVSVGIHEMNQRQNLAILSSHSADKAVASLFGLILQGLPVAPFEELVLLRKTLDAGEPTREVCRFPFFHFLSSWFEDLIDYVYEEASAAVGMDTNTSSPSVTEIAAALATRGRIDATTARRRDVLLSTIQYVEEFAAESPLFDHYLEDFVRSKTGLPNDILLEWVRNKLKESGFSRNILHAHCLTRVHEKEFMSVASWGTQSSQLLCRGVLPDQSTTGGHLVFERVLDHFESSLRTGVSRGEWKSTFQRFLRQVNPLIGGPLDDRGLACRLRVLCFFGILLQIGVPASIEAGALELWYDRDERKLKDFISSDVDSVSLHSFVRVVDGNEAAEAVLMALRLFFSSLWINITTTFRENDFNFLLAHISESTLRNSQLASSLLLGACLSYGSDSDLSPVDGIPRTPIQLICCQLRSSYIPSFSANETRTSLPHYIPHWMRVPKTEGKDTDTLHDDNELGVFFAAYGHSFDGPLADAVWDMILQTMVKDAEGLSSEQLLLLFLQEMEREKSLRREEYIRLSRTRSQPGTPLTGSLLSAIVLSARLLCVVAKVAVEIAIHRDSTALSGAYGQDCHSILERIMSRHDCLWNFFFFHQIMRLRGEGTMASLLGPDGPLHGLNWCQQWVDGAPVFRAGTQANLEAAERALNIAVHEEEQKSREFLLCPNCRNPFIIDQHNCGQFTCGQDAHGGIAGRPVLGGYGCGHAFNVAQAHHYIVDQSVLQPLQDRIEEIRTCIQRGDEGASLWERAKTMNVPVLYFVIETGTNGTMVPTAVLVSQPREDPSSIQTFYLLQRVRSGSDVAFQQRLLPDLIELYVWLHSTFRHLVGRKQASELRMRDIMDEERLRARFDADADHVLGLWQRTAAGLNSYIGRSDCRVLWECEEVEIPFHDVNEAPLIHLLSEGEHPTDGHDFLFLIINSISSRYATFVRTLSEFEVADGDANSMDDLLHPKFVVKGSYGAVALHNSVVLSDRELNLLVQNSWNSELQIYEWHKIDEALRQQLVLHVKRPILMNLMENLRERFVFREEREESSGGESHPIKRGRHGNYFANALDIQLYNDVSQLLEGFELIEGSDQIRRTLEDSFHSLDYDALRALLSGVQRLLELLLLEGKEEMNTLADAMCDAFRLSPDLLESERALVFEQLGLPPLKNSQARELLALQPYELVELVRFVGSQLASEAYLFAKLPLCLKEPLSVKAREELESSIYRMEEVDGLESTLAKINELVRDILSFYEHFISREVLSSTQSLRFFLLKNNALDRTDPVFALIPSHLTLRNYVALRCHLHQLKLSLLYDHDHNEIDHHMETEVDNVKPKRWGCWLWDERDGAHEIDDKDAEESQFCSPADPTDLLWFARGLEPRNTCNPADDMSIDEDRPTIVDPVKDETSQREKDEQPTYVDPLETSRMQEEDTDIQEENAAKRIQRWWRRAAEFDMENHMLEHYVMEDFLHEELSTSSQAEADLELNSQESRAKRARLQEDQPVTNIDGAMMQDGDDDDDDDAHVPYREIDVSQAAGGATANAAAAAASRLEASSVWTSESLNADRDAGGGGGAESLNRLYGNESDETCMRRWLNEHNLPQFVGDVLLNDVGARTIDDIVMVVKECESELNGRLKPLDRIKLKKAVEAYKQAGGRVD